MSSSRMIFAASAYWSKWIPIRFTLLLSVLVIWVLSYWLRKEYGQDDSNLWLVMNLFLKLIQWTVLGLFAFSLFTALSTWGWFLYLVRKKGIVVQAKLGDGHKAEAGKVSLSVVIRGRVFRPLLGTIRARLVFSGRRLSETILLDTNRSRPKQWIRDAIAGSGQVLLHDRGVYDVERVLVYFSDMFGLVMLPCSVPFTQQLVTLPRTLEDQTVRINPHSTEEQKHRIEIPKRTEGELINYKEFETGDSIHRIVWKIYAKSGQLVVRIPETHDPQASHVYFYASFYFGFDLQHNAFETELLNHYKDLLRNLFEALQRNGFDVRMPRDQELLRLSGVTEKKNELYQITMASWQTAVTPTDFIHYNKAAFVCLSSFTPVEEIAVILKNLPASIPVVVAKMSDVIPSPFQLSLSGLFFKPEEQPVDRLRRPWLLSSLRRTLQQNEEQIAEVIRQRGNAWLTHHIIFEK